MSYAIIGTGGHAKVVYEALLLAKPKCAGQVTFRDGDPSRNGVQLSGITIQTPELSDAIAGCQVHVAIGQNILRLELSNDAQNRGANLLTILHPAAQISETATIDDGSFCAAGCVIGPDAQVGGASVINHAAVVDHDCLVGAGCHVAPGAVLGGGVTLGEAVLVGANAAILPGLTIGKGAIVGAGAVVTKSMPAGALWIGHARVPSPEQGTTL
ncbi:MAG: NeuD/PglB/VioB family sugar acetyltransferase [Sulfitobacter sp.]